MKLYPDKLSSHLTSGKLLPVYLVAGDEPLQVGESADAIRAAARADGFESREVFFAERGFDWQSLLSAGNAMSLFAERRILEVRLPTGKPGDAGGKALAELAANPPEDTLLLVVSARVDKKLKWVKALDSAGALVECWPLEPRDLPRWINERMRGAGLAADDDAAKMLAERVEGNLLAAKQEIDKLALLFEGSQARAEDIRDAVANSARFDVFALVDAALMGRADRALRILDGLREEGVEPVLIIWALSREIRNLTDMAFRVAKGESPNRVSAQVWPKKRAPLVERSLQRISHPAWNDLLLEAALADRKVKGVGSVEGREAIWAALHRLTARLAGSPLDTMPS